MEKGKFIVTIEETVSQEFEIEADSLEEALKTAENKYREGEIVVNPQTPESVIAYARTEDGFESTEWDEII